MATVTIRKVIKKSNTSFFSIERRSFFGCIVKEKFTAITLDDAIDKAFSFKNCHNIKIK